MTRFFKDHFTRGHVIATILIAITIVTLAAINIYVLDMTNGCYNAFELAFHK